MVPYGSSLQISDGVIFDGQRQLNVYGELLCIKFADYMPELGDHYIEYVTIFRTIQDIEEDVI